MSVKDLVTGYGNFASYPEYLDRPIRVKRYIDATVTPLTSGDYYKVFAYPVNTEIVGAGLITETVEGASDTIDLTDDSSGTNTIISNHDLNTDNAMTKFVGTSISAGNTVGGLFKATAGHICIKPDAAITVAKFWVYFDSMQYKTTD